MFVERERDFLTREFSFGGNGDDAAAEANDENENEDDEVDINLISARHHDHSPLHADASIHGRSEVVAPRKPEAISASSTASSTASASAYAASASASAALANIASNTSKSDSVSDSDTHIDTEFSPSNILAGSNLGFIENGTTTSNNINGSSTSSSNSNSNSGSLLSSAKKDEEEITDGEEIDKKQNHNSAISQTQTQTQRQTQKIFDNRTIKSSKSKKSIHRAVRFLRHPSIAGMSTVDKDAYLHSKGLKKADIQQAHWIANQPIDVDVDSSKTKKEVYNDSFEDAWDSSSSEFQPQNNSGSRSLNISTNQNGESKGTTAASMPTPMHHANTQPQNQQLQQEQEQQQQQQHQRQTLPQQNQQQQQQQQQHPNNEYNANGQIQTYNQNNNPMGGFGTATTNTHPNMNNMNMDMNMNNMMEHQQLDLPNPLVPMTLGGVIAVFGIAVFRWLNGGEFELFPPSSPGPFEGEGEGEDEGTKSKSEEFGSARIGAGMGMSPNERMMPIEEEYDEDGNDADNLMDYNDDDDDDNNDDDGILEEYEETASALNEGLNNTNHGHGLARDLQSLTLAIEKYTALQEETIKTQFEEKAKKSTNNLMDLLKKKQQTKEKEEDENTSTSTSMEDVSGTSKIQKILHDKTIGLAMLVQLTEVKCSLKTMSDQFSSIGSKQHDDKSKNDNDDDGDCGIVGENLILRKLDEIGAQLQTIESKLMGSNVNGEEEIETINSKQSPTVETRGASNASSMKTEVGHKGNSNNDDDAQVEAETEEPVAIKEEPIKNSEVNALTAGPSEESNMGRDSKETNDALSSQNSDEDERKDDGSGSEKESTVQVGKEALQDALCSMKEANETVAIKTCCQMLYLYVSNLSANPNSKQYQKIYTKNSTFKKKVGNVKFAKDFLLSVGFVDEGSFFLWKKEDNCNGDSANGDLSLLKDAVGILKQFQKEL